jgi:hypothetical protein
MTGDSVRHGIVADSGLSAESYTNFVRDFRSTRTPFDSNASLRAMMSPDRRQWQAIDVGVG